MVIEKVAKPDFWNSYYFFTIGDAPVYYINLRSEQIEFQNLCSLNKDPTVRGPFRAREFHKTLQRNIRNQACL